ncbi:hypothetical protein ACQ4PT_065428 [Festuca glaucescens]
MAGWLPFLLCLFLSVGLSTRQLALAGAGGVASSSKTVTSLPGFSGRLPFHLETGYVEVDEDNGAELFYYFVESEAGGENSPFLLWLTGGDHCSVLSGLALEIGIEAGRSPILNLKGYLVGNPWTGENIDISSVVPYAHGFGIISDELYEMICGHCQGEDYTRPTNALCAQALGTFNNLLSEVMAAQILLDTCAYASSRPRTATEKSGGDARKILSEEAGILMGKQVKNPPPRVPLGCISYTAYLSYYWANDELTREALGIKKGTVDEWVRCQSGNMPFTRDIKSSIKYHRNVTTNGYRALIYRSEK